MIRQGHCNESFWRPATRLDIFAFERPIHSVQPLPPRSSAQCRSFNPAQLNILRGRRNQFCSSFQHQTPLSSISIESKVLMISAVEGVPPHSATQRGSLALLSLQSKLLSFTLRLRTFSSLLRRLRPGARHSLDSNPIELNSSFGTVPSTQLQIFAYKSLSRRRPRANHFLYVLVPSAVLLFQLNSVSFVDDALHSVPRFGIRHRSLQPQPSLSFCQTL